MSTKSLRGIFTLIFLLFILFGGVVFFIASVFAGGKASEHTGEWVLLYGPLFLLGYTLFVLLTSLSEQAINFTASEVDFLFPAPLTRRQLLIYKVFHNLLSAVLYALFLGTMNRMQFPVWVYGIVGVFLCFAFMQLLAMLVSMLSQTATQFANTGPRRLVGVVIIAALAYTTASALKDWGGAEFTEIVRLVSDSPTGKVLLAPFRVYCHAIVSRSFYPEFLLWGGLGLAVNVALVIAIFRLDANFTDAAVRISRKKYDNIRKMQTGGLSIQKVRRSTRLPMFPFMWGIGPMFWRQWVRAIRTAPAVLILMAFVVCGFGVIPFLDGKFLEKISPAMVLGVLAYASFLTLCSLPAGFRGDATRIEVFKGLPVPGWSICLGELFGPTGLATLVHWTVYALSMVVMPGDWKVWLAAAVVSPPLNLLLLSVSNGLFLLFPVQVSVGKAPDFQTGLRNMMTFMLQGVAVFAATSIVALPAGLVYYVTKNVVATAVTAGILLIVVDVLAVLFVCLAYQRFDVTKHLPT